MPERHLKSIALFAALEGQGSGVRTVRFSPAGDLLAAADGDMLSLWAKNEKGLYDLHHRIAATAHTLAFSSDGMLLASAGGRRSVRIWSPDGVAIGELPGNECSVAFSPDGTFLATGDDSGHVHLWETTSWKLLATYVVVPHDRQPLYSSAVGNLCFAMNGTRLAFFCSSLQGVIHVCDIVPSEDGKATWDITLVKTFAQPSEWVSSLAFSPDWQYFVVAAQRRIWFFDAETLTMQKTLDLSLSREPDDAIEDVAFSPCGTYLALATGQGMIFIWEYIRMEQITAFGAYTQTSVPVYLTSVIGGIDWSPDGEILATTSMGVHEKRDVERAQDVRGDGKYMVKLWGCKWGRNVQHS